MICARNSIVREERIALEGALAAFGTGKLKLVVILKLQELELQSANQQGMENCARIDLSYVPVSIPELHLRKS